MGADVTDDLADLADLAIRDETLSAARQLAALDLDVAVRRLVVRYAHVASIFQHVTFDDSAARRWFLLQQLTAELDLIGDPAIERHTAVTRNAFRVALEDDR